MIEELCASTGSYQVHVAHRLSPPSPLPDSPRPLVLALPLPLAHVLPFPGGWSGGKSHSCGLLASRVPLLLSVLRYTLLYLAYT